MRISLLKITKEMKYRYMSLENISKLRLFVMLTLLIKSTLFLALLEIKGADKLVWKYVSFKYFLVQLAFFGILYSFGYLVSGKNQIRFYIILNVLYTLLLIADLWYFRVNRDFLGLKNIFFKGTFNPLGRSLLRPEPIDSIFCIDIILLITWIKAKHIRNTDRRNGIKFAAGISFSAAVIIVSYIWINVLGLANWDERLFKNGWTTLMSSKAPGPLGYHLFEAYSSIDKKLHIGDSKDKEEIKKWLEENKEQLPDNEYKGILEGKNIIFLQLESFENFVINRKTNGKEITPFLNKLTREGMYFNNIYEQNNAGNSIDCDFMVNTSILPLGNHITALNHGDLAFAKSLPRLLKDDGYYTVTTHAEEPCEFNWTELHKNSFGVDKLWDVNQYKYEETVGYGLSDRSFLSQLAEKAKALKSPFFIQAPTLSSHGPFNIAKKYRELNLPEKVDQSYLGGYFESAHYTDKQVEMFVKKLDDEGILDNTVVVIYGDHTGVHKYYDKDIQQLSYEGDWWKPYDHKIPLIIYAKGIQAKTFEASGGQIDILPTMAYMLGVEDSKYRDSIMGRVLVNTNRNATVIKGGNIVGEVQSEKEKEHLLKAYSIADKIIKDRYMEK